MADNFEEMYAVRGYISRKSYKKLTIGTWIRVKWSDTPDAAMLITDDHFKNDSFVLVMAFDPITKQFRNFKVKPTQIVEILGPLQAPQLT